MQFPQQLTAIFPSGTLAAVGGAVRDKLANTSYSPDIDFATTLTPDEVISRLTAAGLIYDSTHARFGTIIAVAGGKQYEITSTRTEIYADSRYPKTQFGASWQQDATRRDFTMNAIYLFPDGTLFDPFNGQTDLQNNLVKFIGDPATRLNEDPLRLYRFARFCGLYGLTGWTDDVNTALASAAPAAQELSQPKIRKELAKLDKAAHAEEVKKRLKALNLKPGA